MVGILECWETIIGDIVLVLFVYGSLTTIMVVILIWLLRNNFKKGVKSEGVNTPN